MIQFISSLFSFLFEKLSGPGDEIDRYKKLLDIGIDKIYNLINNTLYGVLGLILLLIGAITAYFKILYDYDHLKDLNFSAVAIGGAILAIFGLAILFNFKRKKKLLLSNENSTKVSTKTPSALEDALAALIMDYIDERKMEREIYQKPTPPAQAENESIH